MTELAIGDAIKRWDAFCTGLMHAGRDILMTAEQADAVSQAEGLRYLTRLLRSGIEKFVEYSDPQDPFLANVYNEHLKWGLDNPDSLYALAYVDGTREYEIVGNVGSVNYFNFTTAKMSLNAKYEITGVLDGPDVQTDADGNFRVVLSSKNLEANGVHMDPETNSVMVRQTFADRSSEREMSFKIAPIGKIMQAPPLLTEALARSEQAQSFFENTGRTFLNLAAAMRRKPNTLPRVDQDFMLSLGGDPNYAYFWGSFDLAEGEALAIQWPEVPVHEAWNLCLYNFWLESLDYTKGRILLNNNQAIANADGSMTLVVSDQRPAAGNWLETLGHVQGHMMSRWIHPAKLVLPQTKVIRLADADWDALTRRWPE
ncbi:DUF1214 domain-containing protein [Sphingobium baderi]|nr:DUF1214 domain-containing protein [Sphingobium baderi]